MSKNGVSHPLEGEFVQDPEHATRSVIRPDGWSSAGLSGNTPVKTFLRGMFCNEFGADESEQPF